VTDEPAAIRGDYANFKPVPSRKVVQIVIEVPFEQGEAVIRALGMPDPAGGKPCAVALIAVSPERGKAAGASTRKDEAGVTPPVTSPAVTVTPVVGVEPGGEGVPSIAAPPGKQRKRWEDLRPSARAALLTKDPEFQRFLVHSNYAEHATESAADNVLKTLCGVLSKAELDSQETSAKRLRSVEVNFYAWRQAKQHGQLER
jgi:hypothetical protein